MVYDAHLRALDAVVGTFDAPFTVVGHSFGGALAIRLAQRHPGRANALVLLDPAQGLDPRRALDVATAGMAHWTYGSAAAARAAKCAEGWAAVPAEILDEEIGIHLRPSEQIGLPAGRFGWRVSQPATATAWSEMAAGLELPPPGLPTDVVVADRVDPHWSARPSSTPAGRSAPIRCASTMPTASTWSPSSSPGWSPAWWPRRRAAHEDGGGPPMRTAAGRP